MQKTKATSTRAGMVPPSRAKPATDAPAAKTVRPSADNADGMRIIKKYPNRRLYDTEISSYITLEDIRQLIIEGETFEVREAKSGKDISRSVLLQIIAEHEDIGQPILSAQLLTEIIRFYGDSLQGYIGSYLERSVDIFIDQQQNLRSQVSNIVGQTPWPLLNRCEHGPGASWVECGRR